MPVQFLLEDLQRVRSKNVEESGIESKGYLAERCHFRGTSKIGAKEEISIIQRLLDL